MSQKIYLEVEICGHLTLTETWEQVEAIKGISLESIQKGEAKDE